MSGDHDDRALEGTIESYGVGSIETTPMGAAEPTFIGHCEVTIRLMSSELPDWFDVGARVRIGRRR
jgi:hypothetical protein